MKQFPVKEDFLLNSLLIIVSTTLALFYVLATTFASGANSSEQNQVPDSPSNPTQPTSVTTSAQGYQSNQAPFLVKKPFAETYESSLWVNSFFDHKLPIYPMDENSLLIPVITPKNWTTC